MDEELKKEIIQIIRNEFRSEFKAIDERISANSIEIDKLRSDNHSVLADHLERIEALKREDENILAALRGLLSRIEEQIEPRIGTLEKIVVKIYELVLRFHGWAINFPPLQELIESIRKENRPISRKAVEEYINEEEIQCPECMSIHLEEYKHFNNMWRCEKCGLTFSDKPIEDRTELQKEIEGLTFTQLAQKLSKADRFATYRDLLIYIDWLYREIIADLGTILIDNRTENYKNYAIKSFENLNLFIEKYEKLYKKRGKTNERKI